MEIILIILATAIAAKMLKAYYDHTQDQKLKKACVEWVEGSYPLAGISQSEYLRKRCDALECNDDEKNTISRSQKPNEYWIEIIGDQAFIRKNGGAENYYTIIGLDELARFSKENN